MKCFYCGKEFEIDKDLPYSTLKKVFIGEDEFVCCPKCEFEKMGNLTIKKKMEGGK